jgi:hypothetical protein
MSDKLDLVTAYLSKLFKHKELVAAAYHQGVVAKGDDRYDGRGLYELHQARTLVPYAQDTYRLGSSLAKHFDEVLQKGTALRRGWGQRGGLGPPFAAAGRCGG